MRIFICNDYSQGLPAYVENAGEIAAVNVDAIAVARPMRDNDVDYMSISFGSNDRVIITRKEYDTMIRMFNVECR